MYKHHLRLSEAPFHCTLCEYVSRTERDLRRHAKGYKPHKDALAALIAKGEPVPDLDQMLKRNTNPRPVDKTLMSRLTLEESKIVWEQRFQEPIPEAKAVKDNSIQEKMDTDVTLIEV